MKTIGFWVKVGIPLLALVLMFVANYIAIPDKILILIAENLEHVLFIGFLGLLIVLFVISFAIDSSMKKLTIKYKPFLLSLLSLGFTLLFLVAGTYSSGVQQYKEYQERERLSKYVKVGFFTEERIKQYPLLANQKDFDMSMGYEGLNVNGSSVKCIEENERYIHLKFFDGDWKIDQDDMKDIKKEDLIERLHRCSEIFYIGLRTQQAVQNERKKEEIENKKTWALSEK